MPRYSYNCAKCHLDFDVAMKPDEVGKKSVTCPQCKGKRVKRVYTGFFAKTSRKS